MTGWTPPPSPRSIPTRSSMKRRLAGVAIGASLVILTSGHAADAARSPDHQPSNAPSSASGTGARPEPRARDHRRVDFFVDRDGREQPVRTANDWAQRRADILVGFAATTGSLPDRSNLGPVRYRSVPESRVEEAGFVREKLFVDANDGDHIPAWLLRPAHAKSDRRLPAVIALHQTSRQHGKDEIVGLAGSPNLAYARELAQRGFVVIVPEYPSLGEYVYDFSRDRYESGTLKGLWNHLRCVDLLTELPDVDASRIAAIGHSLGGHNAIWLGVVDVRVRAVVSSCGWTELPSYNGGNLKGWDGERYMPRFREAYGNHPDRVPWDYPELIAALAPRGFYSNSPLHDTNFPVEGVRRTVPEAAKIFSLLGVPDRLQVRYPDCGHDFPPEVREEAYRFIEASLAAP